VAPGVLLNVILDVPNPIEDAIDGVVWIPEDFIANFSIANDIDHKGAQKMGIKPGVFFVGSLRAQFDVCHI
jgi:hypothetical protein